MRISTAASWKNGFLPSLINIGGAVGSISTGRPRVSAHRRWNSLPMPLASFTTGIGLRAIVALHALAQRLPGTGRLALHALLEQARLPTWRLWARKAAIEKKDVLKARGYSWSPGEFGRPKCWYRDVSDVGKAEEAAWLRANVMGPDQPVWALRITARTRYSDRCWGWGRGEPVAATARDGFRT